MTRFARSKGSKSSNERVCEEATSWQEMKEQLLEKKKEMKDEENRKKVEQMRNSNYQNFLKDREEQAAAQSSWAEFPNVSENKNKTFKHPPGEASRSKKREITVTDNEMGSKIEAQCNVIEEINITKKIKFSSEHGNHTIYDSASHEMNSKKGVTKPAVKKCKQKKKLNILKEFPNVSEDKTKTNTQSKRKVSKNKNRKIITVEVNEMDSGIEAECNMIVEDNIPRKKTNNEFGNNSIDDDVPIEISSKVELTKPVVQKRKQKKKKLNIVLVEQKKELDIEVQSKAEENNKDEKNKGNKQMRKLINMDSLPENEKKKILKKQERRRKQVEKKKLKKQQTREKSRQIEENGDGTSIGAKTENLEGNPNEYKNQSEKLVTDQGLLKSKRSIKNNRENGTHIHKEEKLINMDSLPENEQKKILKKQERRRKQIETKKLKKQLAHEKSRQIEENGKGTLIEEKIEKLKGNPNEYEEQSEKLVTNQSLLKSKQPIINNRENATHIHKKEKLESGDFKRRKTFQPNRMMINGKEVDIFYYDGFPIKKEDAENLKKLKKGMISKGLPRSEIARTLKLERRKAEKSLAREKKNVCFNCRKFGHNLSECTELSNNGGELIDSTGTGICFKCGSTEHTSFACKVVQGQNFKFATCFICKEQGHISRQCPDNARGLYPKGGSCKVCGDVTHLKKDCPKFRGIQEREQEKFQLEAISRGNPEDIDEGINHVKKLGSNSIKPNKVIKF